MSTDFKCPSCDSEHSFEGNVTIRFRDGQIRHFSPSEDPVDLCPNCGTLSKEVKGDLAKRGLANFKSRPGGHVSNTWS